MARDALKAARKHLGHVAFDVNTPVLDSFPPETESARAGMKLPPAQQVRLLARYGLRNYSSMTLAAKQSSTCLTSGRNSVKPRVPKALSISMTCSFDVSVSVCLRVGKCFVNVLGILRRDSFFPDCSSVKDFFDRGFQ